MTDRWRGGGGGGITDVRGGGVRLSAKARGAVAGGGVTDRWRGGGMTDVGLGGLERALGRGGGGEGGTTCWRPRQRVRLSEKARGAAARAAL